ncbi:7629_t:CDS:2, partial [Acaulospora colombiana]
NNGRGKYKRLHCHLPNVEELRIPKEETRVGSLSNFISVKGSTREQKLLQIPLQDPRPVARIAELERKKRAGTIAKESIELRSSYEIGKNDPRSGDIIVSEEKLTCFHISQSDGALISKLDDTRETKQVKVFIPKEQSSVNISGIVNVSCRSNTPVSDISNSSIGQKLETYKSLEDKEVDKFLDSKYTVK